MKQGIKYVVYSVNDYDKALYKTNSLSNADDWVGLDTDIYEIRRVGLDGEETNVTFYEEDEDDYSWCER